MMMMQGCSACEICGCDDCAMILKVLVSRKRKERIEGRGRGD